VTASSGTGSGATADASEGGDTMDAAEAGGPSLTCLGYCQKVLGGCTGNDAQYEGMTSCLTACALLPFGNPSDTSGDTIGCRAHYAQLATSTPNPNCWYAGPLGYGACGDACEAFCKFALGYCTAPGETMYMTQAACETACATFPKIDQAATGDASLAMIDTANGYNSVGPTTGNTLDCRAYHLVDIAMTSPDLAMQHCPHANAMSDVCK
jgi:hypothetical protein